MPARIWSVRRLPALMTIAALLLAVPYGVLRLGADFIGPYESGHLALAAGTLAQMMLFAAPAFVVLHRLGLLAAVAASVQLLGRLPLSIPLAVVVLAALHAPTMLLRGPTLDAASSYDPDWVLWAIVGQIPADILGGFLAAAFGAHFALRARNRVHPSSRRVVATAALLVLALQSSGCGDVRARDVQQRYAVERWVERADRRADELLGEARSDSSAWLQVAGQYQRALRITGETRLATPVEGSVQAATAKLAGRALLGRADAWARAGRHGVAAHAYQNIVEQAEAHPGIRGDAQLGKAQAIDRAGDWERAFAVYSQWLEGVSAGTWPLHRNGLEIPGYVSRRLRARGESEARKLWVDGAESALESAAERGQLARAARSARFGLLLESDRWEAAYAALRRMREVHDPAGHDGALLVAEASLLAGGLGQPDAALDVLSGLTAEENPFDNQYRVAGWLLAAQIHERGSEWERAHAAYESAAREARSDAGRSEALLGLGRVQVARGEIDTARHTFTQLRELYGNTAAGLRASLEELQLVRTHGTHADLEALLPVAVHHYRRVMQQHGTETPALLAAAALSECFGVAGQWERGVTLLDSLSGTLASDTRGGTLLVRAARIAQWKLHDPPRARRLLASLHARYPQSDVAQLARGLEDSLDLAVP